MDNTVQDLSKLEKIEHLSLLDPEKLTSDQIEFLFEICRNSLSDEERAQAAGLLSIIYEKIAHKDKDFALRVHELYLRHLLKPNVEFGHPSCNEIFSVIIMTVFLSVFAHGITSVPLSEWYAKKIEEFKHARKEIPEHVKVTEMPTRIKWKE